MEGKQAGRFHLASCVYSPVMTMNPPLPDDAAFDRMFAASLASMSKTPTPEALRASIQALIDQSGLSHDKVAIVLRELCDECAGKVG